MGFLLLYALQIYQNVPCLCLIAQKMPCRSALFWMPLAYIIRLYNGLLYAPAMGEGGVAFHDVPTHSPAYGGLMRQALPSQLVAMDCTICDRLKIEGISFDHFWTKKGYREKTIPLAPVQMIALLQNRDFPGGKIRHQIRMHPPVKPSPLVGMCPKVASSTKQGSAHF